MSGEYSINSPEVYTSNVMYHFLSQLWVFHDSRTKCNFFWINYCCLSKNYQKSIIIIIYTADSLLIFVFDRKFEFFQAHSTKKESKKHRKNHELIAATF